MGDIDPTRDYIFETRTIKRSGLRESFAPKAKGHYRLASVQVMQTVTQVVSTTEQPAKVQPVDTVDVLLVWEPILLTEQQETVWKVERDAKDHIRNLKLDARTNKTLEAAGVTSITTLKALSDDEFSRLRLSGPLSFPELRKATGRR